MNDRRAVVIPILLITVGTGWLLTTLGIAPGINWVWTLGLAIIGILTIVLCGWDKFSAVVGPFFLITSLLSVMRQTGRLALDNELPILVIVLGVLLLLARMPAIPAPNWLVQEPPPS